MKTGEFQNPLRKVVGRTIWHYDVVESTNETLKELLDNDIGEGLVVWADRQAAGKGRHGRAWASPPGGLYLSILLRPKEVHAQVLGLLAGMPLVKTLRHFGVFATLKWPNDAIFQDRKLAGILSERDYARKMMIKGRDSHSTKVKEIMTTLVVSINPETRLRDCMSLMTEKRIRHLPVFQGDKLVGVVSIGDVVKSLLSEQDYVISQQAYKIDQLENYISLSP